MSKAKLIELIKASDFDLTYWLAETPINEVRKVFAHAIKDVEKDTKEGCGKASKQFSEWYFDGLRGMVNKAQEACLNYQDKDLEEL